METTLALIRAAFLAGEKLPTSSEASHPDSTELLAELETNRPNDERVPDIVQ